MIPFLVPYFELIVARDIGRVLSARLMVFEEPGDVVWHNIPGPCMVDNILPGISGEVGKIGIHHGDGGVFLDDDGGGAGVLE